MVVSFPEATCSLNECDQNIEMGKMNERNYLTTREVAERMGVRISTVRRAAEDLIRTVG